MVTITLPPELEQVVTEQSKQQGTTPELLTLDKLRALLLPAGTLPLSTSGTLADYLGEFIGCLDSGELVPGGARMSENIGGNYTTERDRLCGQLSVEDIAAEIKRQHGQQANGS